MRNYCISVAVAFIAYQTFMAWPARRRRRRLMVTMILYVNDFALSSEKFKFVMYADDTTLTSTLETFSTNELNGN